jgi:Fe-S-cluster containining protein
MDSTIFDCRKCGACCGEQLIVLTSRDARVPVAMRSPDGCWLGQQSGRCVALAGRIGIDPRCTIYEARPEMCRAFGAGSAHCQMIREAYSIKVEP